MKRKSAELADLLARQSRLQKVIKFIDDALTAVRKEKHKLEIEKLQIGHSLSDLLKSKSRRTIEAEPKPIIPEYNMNDINEQNLDLEVPGVIGSQNNGYMPIMHPTNDFPQNLHSFDTESVQPLNSFYFVNMYENPFNNPNPDSIISHPNICVPDLLAFDELYLPI